jgi:NADH dehydrogenase/NADH:ubiquinone oxidoreductase subunit G
VKKIILPFTLIFVTLIGTPNLHNAVAHTFSGDESASFLALVEMIKIEAHLAQRDLSSNITLAQEHANHTGEHLDMNQTKEIAEKNQRLANELNSSLIGLNDAFNSKTPPTPTDINEKVSNLDAILGEIISARISKDQLDNVTVKALTINDLIGETLEHYGEAVGHEENASSSNMTSHGSNGSESVANTSTHNENTTANATTIINQVDYESAQAIASRVSSLFNELKPSVPSNASSNTTTIENALKTLKDDIDKKVPFDTLDGLVDEQVIPVLNSTFNLKLKE